MSNEQMIILEEYTVNAFISQGIILRLT